MKYRYQGSFAVEVDSVQFMLLDESSQPFDEPRSALLGLDCFHKASRATSAS